MMMVNQVCIDSQQASHLCKMYGAFSTLTQLNMVKFHVTSFEKKSYEAGGGNFKAPAQRIQDFINSKTSQNIPECSYGPGIRSENLQNVLPAFIHKRLAGGFREFGKKMKGYLSNEAIIVATESRTSSPVR